MEEFFSRKLSGSKVLSFIDLVRPWNSVIYFLAIFYAAAFAKKLELISLFSLVLVLFLMYSAGAILNDLIDYRIDKESMPYRPLASGRIKASEARKMMFLLWAAGLAAGIIGGLWSVLLAVSLLVIGVSYSLWLERIPFLGPITLAYGAFFVPGLLGMMAFSGHADPLFVANIFLLTLFLSALISTKDFKDARYDARHGKKTIVTEYGVKKSMTIIRTWIIASGVLSSLFAIIVKQYLVSGVIALFTVLSFTITHEKDRGKMYAHERALVLALLLVIISLIFL